MPEFINSAGVSYKIFGLSPLLAAKLSAAVEKEFKQSGRWVSVPTYEVKLLGGSIEVHEHTEASLSTDEERQKWVAYQDCQKAMSLAANERIMKKLFLCVEPTPDQMKDYCDELEFLGSEVPANQKQLLNDFVTDRVICGAEDLMNLTTAIMKASGSMDEDTASAAEAQFRLILQGQAGIPSTPA